MEIQESKKLKYVFSVVLTVFLVSLTVLTGVFIVNKLKEGQYIGQEIETRNTITVSDTGEIYAKPDLAVIDFSVISEAKTVTGAMSDNTEKMNAVIEVIKGQGVEAKDLKTTNFNIYPRYEWYEKSEIYPQGKRVLVGYEVQQTLEVKIRDMAKIGQVIEKAVEAGANQVGDLTFTIDKQDELKKQARKEAIEKAKTKAKELANQLGVGLVRITNFSESAVVPIPQPFYLEKAAGMGGEETPRIETGENKIEVTVSITYEIR